MPDEGQAPPPGARSGETPPESREARRNRLITAFEVLLQQADERRARQEAATQLQEVLGYLASPSEAGFPVWGRAAESACPPVKYALPTCEVERVPCYTVRRCEPRYTWCAPRGCYRYDDCDRDDCGPRGGLFTVPIRFAWEVNDALWRAGRDLLCGDRRYWCGPRGRYWWDC